MNTKDTGMPDTAAPKEAPKAEAPAEVLIVQANPWTDRINAYALLVKKPADDITKALIPLVGDADKSGLEVLSDPTALSDADLRGALVLADPPKIALGLFNKHLGALRGPQPLAAATAAASDGTGSASFDILPSVPDDTSFIDMLKTGGVLKVEAVDVLAALKVAIADQSGVYDLPERITEIMESTAERLEEPLLGTRLENYNRLYSIVTSRRYADVLQALGTKSSVVTEVRKRDFMNKLNSNFWGALASFHDVLLSWNEQWMRGMANPAALTTVLLSGRSGMPMPAGMMAPPETAQVRDASESFNNSVNKVFAGFGIPIVRALAADAVRIKQAMEDPALPSLVGVLTREEMLKLLRVDIASDYVRTERNVTRYALGVMDFPRTTAGNEELAYLNALIQLGLSIQWDKLPSGTATRRAGLGNTVARPERNGGNRIVNQLEDEEAAEEAFRRSR